MWLWESIPSILTVFLSQRSDEAHSCHEDVVRDYYLCCESLICMSSQGRGVGGLGESVPLGNFSVAG